MSSTGAIILGLTSILFSFIVALYNFFKCSEEGNLFHYIIVILSLMSFIYCVNSLWMILDIFWR